MILLGEKDEEALENIAILATACWAEGRREEAEKLNLRLGEASKVKFGENHSSTPARMVILVSTYMG